MKYSELITKIVRENPVLPHDIQLSLVREWQEAENKGSLDKLVLSNIRLVSKEAFKIRARNSYLNYEDLMQEGLAGLVKAADMFDLKQDVVFMTYAMLWAKANMRRYVMDHRSIVRLGTTRADRKIFSNLSKALMEADESDLSGEVRLNKVAEILDVGRGDLDQMMVTLKGFDASFDAPAHKGSKQGAGGGAEVTALDLHPDNNDVELNILTKNERTFLSEAMKEILKSLPDDERSVISKRFLTHSPRTLRDLAKDMNISREWVRQIEMKALDRIKKKLATSYNVRGL